MESAYYMRREPLKRFMLKVFAFVVDYEYFTDKFLCDDVRLGKISNIWYYLFTSSTLSLSYRDDVYLEMVN